MVGYPIPYRPTRKNSLSTNTREQQMLGRLPVDGLAFVEFLLVRLDDVLGLPLAVRELYRRTGVQLLQYERLQHGAHLLGGVLGHAFPAPAPLLKLDGKTHFLIILQCQ